MASAPLLSFRPAGVRTFAATSGDSRSGRKVGGAGGGSWWTPLFGWPAEPDYIEESGSGAAGAAEKKTTGAGKEALEMRGGTTKSVAFTEDKARRLRMMTAETSAFHDIMYHSAIASRLASDFSGRSDD
ncbi:unnamed protein product [Spirodela intermedia]|uniref:Uncharacterized protein n=1 Tax=Spirodela intermedia TaxID=51605 RepID=A0A7I8KZ84_SPIIN|nr:unnamed protein product [Spirodela intermedia]